MSVRREKRRDPISGKQREFWMIDVDYEYPDGSRKRVRKVSPVPTRRGAEEYERQIRDELLNPTQPKKEVPIFSDFVEQRWLPTYPQSAGNRNSTIVEKTGHIRRYLSPAFSVLRLDEITTERIDRMLADMAKRDLAPQTRKNAAATLRRILRSAVEWEVLEKVPAIPKVRVPSDSPYRGFKSEETTLLLQATQGAEQYAILLFAFDTGARAGEQLALCWEDVDLSASLPSIRIHRSSTLGHVGSTKSGKARVIPLSAGLVQALKAIKHERSPWVFCGPNGLPLTLWQLRGNLKRACRAAGLPFGRWHDLRHSFASQLVKVGVPMRQIQDLLGHSSIVLTQRYSHVPSGSGHVVVDALNRARSGPEDSIGTERQHSGNQPQDALARE